MPAFTKRLIGSIISVCRLWLILFRGDAAARNKRSLTVFLFTIFMQTALHVTCAEADTRLLPPFSRWGLACCARSLRTVGQALPPHARHYIDYKNPEGGSFGV